MKDTGKTVRYLICLFAAAAVLIFAGGFKKTRRNSAEDITERNKIRTAANRYLSSGDRYSAPSPEFVLYAAAGSNLRPATPDLFR